MRLPLSRGTDRRMLAIVRVEYRGVGQELYAMPLMIEPEAEPGDVKALVRLAESPSPAGEWIYDATDDAESGSASTIVSRRDGKW
ncbi:MAG: hypothetical protein HC794_09535, partial [Nitrospiraceae bacterium]|nr:hypothetical protein [Nitrospiraceae bacterium]